MTGNSFRQQAYSRIKRAVGAANLVNICNLIVVFMKEHTIEKLLETSGIPLGAFVIVVCGSCVLGVRALRQCSSSLATLAIMAAISLNLYLVSTTVLELAIFGAASHVQPAPASPLPVQSGTHVSGRIVVAGQPAGKVGYYVGGSEDEHFTNRFGAFDFQAEAGTTEVRASLGANERTFRIDIPPSATNMEADLDLQSGTVSVTPSWPRLSR